MSIIVLLSSIGLNSICHNLISELFFSSTNGSKRWTAIVFLLSLAADSKIFLLSSTLPLLISQRGDSGISLKISILVLLVVALLFYVHGKHLRSCRDGQLT